MNEILIRKAKKGDKDAFCRLIDENVQSMYKVAAAYLKNDEDVADAIQDTILSCYENLKSLKQNRYFKTWMIRILINKCKDMIQKKKENPDRGKTCCRKLFQLYCTNARRFTILLYDIFRWLRYLVSQDQESSKQGRGKNTGGCNVV